MFASKNSKTAFRFLLADFFCCSLNIAPRERIRYSGKSRARNATEYISASSSSLIIEYRPLPVLAKSCWPSGAEDTPACRPLVCSVAANLRATTKDDEVFLLRSKRQTSCVKFEKGGQLSTQRISSLDYGGAFCAHTQSVEDVATKARSCDPFVCQPFETAQCESHVNLLSKIFPNRSFSLPTPHYSAQSRCRVVSHL